jgi:hypothetical protein
MTRNHLLLLAPLTLTLAVAPACSNSNGSIDIGRNVGNQLADYAASWDGYAEAYNFSDSSDRVRITLDESGQGALVVGDQAAPAPLQLDDPNLNPVDINPVSGLVAGVSYRVVGAHIAQKRIQLGINLNEQYRSWCAAQPPICTGESCNCLPPNFNAQCGAGSSCLVTNVDTGETSTVSSAKLYLCAAVQVCACTTLGCSIGGPTALFDAALDNAGTELVGSLVLGERVTVRMSRN